MTEKSVMHSSSFLFNRKVQRPSLLNKNAPRVVHRCVRKSFAFGKSHLARKV